MQWFLKALQNYAVFQGRARRKEYWMFGLFTGLFSLVLVAFLAATQSDGAFVLIAIFYLAMILPSLSVTVRRLHDIGRSGWWILINLVPFGGLVLFIFSLLDSQPGANQFGPNPKELNI